MTKFILSIPKNNGLSPKETSGSNQYNFGYFETIGCSRPTQEDALYWEKLKTLGKLTPQQIGARLWTTHKQIDHNFCRKSDIGGSTAVTAVYDGKGNIITAILADSAAFAAVYDKSGKVIGVVRLNSVTHTPSDPRERDRIILAGGDLSSNNKKIRDPETGSQLAVSRGIGDLSFKKSKRIQFVDPELDVVSSASTIDITSVNQLFSQLAVDKSQVGKVQIILTCDGFTDGAGVTRQQSEGHSAFLTECLKKIKRPMSEKDLAQYLANQAITNGSTDNVSVAVQTIFSNQTQSANPVLMGVYDGHTNCNAAVYAATNIGQMFSLQCSMDEAHYMRQSLSIYQKRKLFLPDHSEEEWTSYLNGNIEQSLHPMQRESSCERPYEPVKHVYSVKKPGRTLHSTIKRSQMIVEEQLQLIRIEEEGLENRGHYLASHAAKNLYTTLKTHFYDYFTHKIDMDSLKLRCNEAISMARPAMENYDSSMKLLKNLALFIVTFGVGYVVASAIYYHNTNHIMFFRTPEACQLDQLQKAINKAEHWIPAMPGV